MGGSAGSRRSVPGRGVANGGAAGRGVANGGAAGRGVADGGVADGGVVGEAVAGGVVPGGMAAGLLAPARPVPVRRSATRPVPTGPGRPRPRVRVAGRRAGAARLAPGRPAPVRASTAVARVGARVGGWRTAGAVALAALGAAVVVSGLGLLADAVRDSRVPEATGMVQVRAGESVWQVARRAAPSADPGAVAGRIIELNDLDSSSVRAGQVLITPIG